MEDIIQRIARISEEKNLPKGEEHFDRYVRAMDAAEERVKAERGTSGKQLSEPERLEAKRKYFQIEAAKLGMPEAEIEGRWYVHVESLKIIEGIEKEGVDSAI